MSATSPGNGGTLGPEQAISINFSRDMNPVAVKKAVVLTPAPAGGYQLQQSSSVPGRFLLEPNLPLQPGVTYTLAIAKSALDVDGNQLQRPALVHFVVGRLGSTSTVVFPAGPSSTDYTEVLAASPPPVSYTHLDVYKRQLLLPGAPPASRCSGPWSGSCPVSPRAGAQDPRRPLQVVAGQPRDSIPARAVSYTHLCPARSGQRRRRR